MLNKSDPLVDTPALLRNDNDGIATLTLNRPNQRNALSTHLMDALQHQLDLISMDQKIRVVIIAANGQGFCSGHDLKEIRENPGRENYKTLFKKCSKLMLTITQIPQPVIARVHGLATAAGCQLVATCDLAIAGRSAWFATPGVHIGLFCSTPMVALTRNIGRKQAMEMLLLGEKVGPEEAEKWGLINKVVDDDHLDSAIHDITKKITEKSSLVISIGKEAFYNQLDLNLNEAYSYASEIITKNMLAFDAEEGIDAFLEKRNPIWKDR